MIFYWDYKGFVTMTLEWEVCTADFEISEYFSIKIKEADCKALKSFEDLKRDSTQF